MSTLLTEIKKMTIEEKLQAMELLWNALQEDTENIDIPDWHREILDQREKRADQGNVQYTEMKNAKKHIEKTVQ